MDYFSISKDVKVVEKLHQYAEQVSACCHSFAFSFVSVG